jgi:hypothetical protein
MSNKKTGNLISSKANNNLPFIGYILAHLFLFVAWWLIYSHLQAFSVYCTYSLLHVAKASRLGSTLEFFFYDTPKVFMLLGLIVYIVGILRSFITPEKTKQFLVGKSEFVGNILAALLGIITPFCSCSAVPLFIGFVSAGIPLGVTFSFLISAPMVNEIALVLLYGLLGWKIAAIYLITGISIAIVAGLIISKLHPENYIEDWVKDIRLDTIKKQETKTNWRDRILFAYSSVIDIFKCLWIYVFIGIAIGAIIHGYVPESFMVLVMGAHSWWSVPLAVLLGIPLYSNATGIIPVVEALIGKGAAVGTVLAFMMSVIALSFPEMVMLRKILKPRLIGMFLIIVTIGIIIVGYLFNAII